MIKLCDKVTLMKVFDAELLLLIIISTSGRCVV